MEHLPLTEKQAAVLHQESFSKLFSLFPLRNKTKKIKHQICLLIAVCFLTFDRFHGQSCGLSFSAPHPSFKDFNQFSRFKVPMIKLQVLLTLNSVG